jgi:hypothetical protein
VCTTLCRATASTASADHIYTHTRTTVIVDETVEWKFILRPSAFVVSPFCIAATLKGFRFVAAEYT